MNRVVIFSAGHTEPGGAARRASLYARTFVERGWRVRVITRAGLFGARDSGVPPVWSSSRFPALDTGDWARFYS